MTRDQRIAINMSCISGLMLIASFLPWGRVASSVASDKFGVGNEAVQGLMGLIGDRIYIPISGWIGSLMIGGVEFLNWLPLVALAAVATLAWLRATGVTRTPHAVLLLLLLYATIHLAGIFLTFFTSEHSRLGFGWFLSAGTVLLAFWALVPKNEPIEPACEPMGVE